MGASIALSAPVRSTPGRVLSPATRALIKAHDKAITGDPEFATLRRIERQLMRQLIKWHNPFTGYLQHRTKDAKLAAELDVCTETIRLARKGLIRRGLITGYLPGDGRRAGTYAIARSWDEAKAAAELRNSPDAPWFPDLPDRSTPTLPGPRADGADGDQAPADGANPTENQPPATDDRPAAKPSRPQRRRRRGERPTPGPADSAGVLEAMDSARWDRREEFVLQRAQGAALARATLREEREKRAAKHAAIKDQHA